MLQVLTVPSACRVPTSRLKRSQLKVRFCTNDSQKSRRELVGLLQRQGFDISEGEVTSPAPATSLILKERGLRPHLLIHDGVRSEFDQIDTSNPNCVVIADAGEGFSYQNMNKAFRVLMDLEKPVLISLGKGRYYKETSGLMLDVGAYMKALEYACGIEAEVVGKPSPEYFQLALKEMGVEAHEVGCLHAFGWRRSAVKSKRTGHPPRAFHRALLEFLVCLPSEKRLRYETSTNELMNEESGRAYPIIDGIPHMSPWQDCSVLPPWKKSSYEAAPAQPAWAFAVGDVELVPSSRWFTESVVEKTVGTCLQPAKAALMSVLDMMLGTLSAPCVIFAAGSFYILNEKLPSPHLREQLRPVWGAGLRCTPILKEGADHIAGFLGLVIEL
ncbi:hypothetical protein GH733_001237 [Mirounga leonina]|nr:hypothetical protein GH733_001237 [Mirounga leonina]